MYVLPVTARLRCPTYSPTVHLEVQYKILRRRRSCGEKAGSPAAMHALATALRNLSPNSWTTSLRRAILAHQKPVRIVGTSDRPDQPTPGRFIPVLCGEDTAMADATRRPPRTVPGGRRQRERSRAWRSRRRPLGEEGAAEERLAYYWDLLEREYFGLPVGSQGLTRLSRYDERSTRSK